MTRAISPGSIKRTHISNPSGTYNTKQSPTELKMQQKNIKIKVSAQQGQEKLTLIHQFGIYLHQILQIKFKKLSFTWIFQPLRWITHQPLSRTELQRLTIIINSGIIEDLLFFIKKHSLVMDTK